MELIEQLERVNDEESFLMFVRMLAKDRMAASAMERESQLSPYRADAGGWENTSIETFLEAAIAWAEDSKFGTTQGLGSANPWRKLAVFLYCGKVYE